VALRRGVGVVIFLLVSACLVSFVGLMLMWLMVGREPSVPSRSTLVLRIEGDPVEGGAEDGFSQYLPGSRPHSVRSLVENIRKAKVDSRVSAPCW